jgi:hypothetical protein
VAILGLPREGVIELMKGRIPQGRFLQPEEVAAAVVYLSVPESDGVTGPRSQMRTMPPGSVMPMPACDRSPALKRRAIGLARRSVYRSVPRGSRWRRGGASRSCNKTRHQ